MILADSTFLVDSLRKNPDVKVFLERNPDEILFTTEINVFELYLGLYSSKELERNPELFKKRSSRLEKLIVKFQILPFGRKEVIRSAKILGSLVRNGKMIDFRDGLVAGIALSNGVTKVLTRNVEHFNRIEALRVITY